MGMIMGVHLPNLEVSQLPAIGGKLSHLLTSDSELLGQPLVQLCLFDERVPNVLLTMEEQGFLSVVSHEGLRGRYKLEA